MASSLQSVSTPGFFPKPVSVPNYYDPNLQWKENGTGGVNYFADGKPITREDYQIFASLQDPTVKVDNLEKFAADRYNQQASGSANVSYDPYAAQRAANAATFRPP